MFKPLQALMVGGAIAAVCAQTGFAAVLPKADTADDLNTANAWGGTVPGVSDIASWPTTLTNNLTNALGGNVTWGMLSISNLTAATAKNLPMQIGATPGATLNLVGWGASALTNINAYTLRSNSFQILCDVNFSATSSNIIQAGTVASNYILLGGKITAASKLVHFGSGTILITNDNSASGWTSGFQNSAGQLAIGHDNALGTGPLIWNGGNLVSDSATPRTIANPVTLNGLMIAGSTNINTGALTFHTGAWDASSGTRGVLWGGDVTINSVVAGTVARTFIMGAGAGVSGVLTLGGNNGAMGLVVITNGTVVVNSINDQGVDGPLFNAPVSGSSVCFSNLNTGASAYASPTLRIGAASSASRMFSISSNTLATFEVPGGVSATLGGVISNYPAAATGGHLIKTGQGTLTLNGAATFAGNITNTAGSLVLGSAATIPSVSNIFLASGTVLDVSAQPASTLALSATVPQSLSGFGSVVGTIKVSGAASSVTVGSSNVVGTLALQGLDLSAGNATLNLDLNYSPAGPNDQLIVTNLALGAVTFNINPLAGILTNGVYVLVSYTTATGTLTPALNLGSAALARQTFVISNDTGGSRIVLHASGTPSSLVWNGGDTLAPTSWDINTSTNWKVTAANDSKFFNGDSVKLFSIEAGANTNINIAATVVPQSVVVSNGFDILTGTNGYTNAQMMILRTANGGKISGAASLLKIGQGTLVVSNANDYLGATTVTNGTVRLMTGAELGSRGGNIVISNGGVLDLNGTAAAGYRWARLSGAGFGGFGVITNGSTGSGLLTNVALDANATIGSGNGPWDIREGAFQGNGFTLTKKGLGGNIAGNTNTTVIYGAGETDLGDMLVTNSGSLGFSTTTTLGRATNTVTLGGGRLLLTNLTGVYTNISKKLRITANSFLDVNQTPINWNGDVTLTAGILSNRAAMPLVINGNISGAGNYRQNGVTTVYMNGSNTYTGYTYIFSGTNVISSISNVNAGVATSLGNPSSVTNGVIWLGFDTTAGAGTGSQDGTLRYVGSGHWTDRLINVGSKTGNSSIEASGTGPLVFTAAGLHPSGGAGAKTMVLRGTNTDTNTIYGGFMDNTAVNKTSLAKSDTGTWVLAGQNTFSGGVSVNGGRLKLAGNGSVASAPVICVSNQAAIFDVSQLSAGGYVIPDGQTLMGIGTNVGQFILTPGSTLQAGRANKTAGTNTFANDLTFQDGSSLTFDLGSDNTTNNDLIVVDGTVTNQGTVRIYINYLTGHLSQGDYVILNSTGGLQGKNYQLGAEYGNVTLDVSDNLIIVRVGEGGSNQKSIQWTGALSGIWSAQLTDVNWELQAGGIGTNYANPDVVLFGDYTSAGTAVANSAISLAATVAPGSMTFTNELTPYSITGSAVSIGGSGTLYKTNAASLTLGVPFNSKSKVTVDGGGLTVTANGAINNGTLGGQGVTLVADFPNTTALLTNAGSIGTFKFNLANSNNSVGVIYNNGGTINALPGTAADSFIIGGGQSKGDSNSIGYLEVNGGTVQSGDMRLGNYTPGVLRINAGLVRATNLFYASVQPGSTSVVDVAGGILMGPPVTAATVSPGYNGNSVWNVRNSGTIWVSNNNFTMARGANNPSNTTILNLMSGGTIYGDILYANNPVTMTNGVWAGTGSNTVINFNGGKLVVATSRGTYSNRVLQVDSTFIYPNGAIIDTLTNVMVFTNNFRAPTGKGVASIAVTAGGSGYLFPPMVVLARDGVADSTGTNATAVAEIDHNGTVTNVLVTSPGIDYVQGPTVGFIGRLRTGGVAATATANLTAASQASGGLTKRGTGTLVLGPLGLVSASTYTNKTIVEEGLLVVLGNNLIASPIEVKSGGFLSVTGLISVPLTFDDGAGLSPGGGIAATMPIPSGLSITNPAFIIDLTNNTTLGGGVSDLITVAGDLNLTGTLNLTLRRLAAQYTDGTYTFLTYTGTRKGRFIGTNIVALNANPNQTFTLQEVPGALQVTIVTTGNDLKWAGLGDLWDKGISANWTNTSLGITTFADGDRATFDDFGAAQPVVTLASTNFPSLVTVGGSNTYTFFGAGKISGGTGLNKTGIGFLVVSNVNDYTGSTTISNGTLRLAGSGEVGSRGGIIQVASSGVIDLNGAAAAAYRNYRLGGAGFGGFGLITNSGTGGAYISLTNVTLTANAAVGSGPGGTGFRGWDIRGPIVGGGFTLTKWGVGGNTLASNNTTIIYGAGDTDLGDIIITNSGTLGFSTTSSVGRAANTIYLGGGRLSLTNLTGIYSNVAKNMKLTASSMLDVATTPVNWSGEINLNGLTLTNRVSSALIINGAITNTGNYRQNNVGTTYMNGANTYSGVTYIFSGTVVATSLGNVNAGVATSLGNPSSVTNGVIWLGYDSSTTAGSGSQDGTLKYVGPGHLTDRLVNVASKTGSSTIDASGTGALIFTAAALHPSAGAGAKTLVLRGTSTADNEIMGGFMDNTVVNKTGLNKLDAGTWVLSGASTFSGNVGVSGGRLKLKGTGSLASSPVICVTNATAIFDVSQLASGSYVIPDGQTLMGIGTNVGQFVLTPGSSLQAGALNRTAGTNTFANDLTIQDGSSLTFDLGNDNTTNSDFIQVDGSVTNLGTVYIYLNYLSGHLSEGDYIVLNSTLGLQGKTYQLGAEYGNVTLVVTDNQLIARVGVGGSNQKSIQWTGALAGNWSAQAGDLNWEMQADGSSTNYANPDIVLFGDYTFAGLPVANSAISLLANVAPGSMTFTNEITPYSITGAGVAIEGSGTLYKTNAAALTLGVPFNPKAKVTVDGGSVTLTANGAINNGTLGGLGTLLVSDRTNTTAILTNAGAIGTFKLNVANSNNTVGVVYNNGGTINALPGTAADSFIIGNGQTKGDSNAIGYLEVNGGTVQSGDMRVGNYAPGMLRINAGLVRATNQFFASVQPMSTSVVDVVGGILMGPPVVAATVSPGYVGNSVWNVRNAGVIWVSNNNFTMARGAGTPSNTTILNLMSGGTIYGDILYANNPATLTNWFVTNIVAGVSTNIVTNTLWNGTGSNTVINFNGGKLVMATSRGTYSNRVLQADSTFIYTNGAIIDTGNNPMVFTNNFRAPSGKGVENISIAAGGSGYLFPPLVVLQRDGVLDSTGTNATAVAEIDQNGTVTNVVVTSPGIDYVQGPSVGFIGRLGAGGVAATATANLTADLQASGGLTKRGPGTLVLGPLGLVSASTYTNKTIVEEGTLVVLGNNLLSSPIEVKSGGFLSVTGALSVPVTYDTGAGLSPGGWGIAATMPIESGLSLIDPAFSLDLTNDASIVGGRLNDLVAVNGDLNLSGKLTINVRRTASQYVDGTYTFLTYTGARNGSFSSTNIVAVGSNPNQVFTLQEVPGALQISIFTLGKDLTWAGQGDLWDKGVSLNWANVDLGLTTFADGDRVVFDETGAVQPVVNLVTTNFPAALTVNGTSNYTFNGIGKVSGLIGITKTGNGVLTINTTNDYLGNTLLLGGVIKLGNNAANIGATNGIVSIDNTARLDVNGQTLATTKAITIGSSGGSLTNSAPALTATVRGTVTLNGDLTLGGENGALSLTNVISGAGNITKVGTNRVVIQTAVNTVSGAMTVEGGELHLGAGTPLSPAVSLTLNNNAMLVLGGGNLTLPLGTDVGQINMNGNGGFSANGAARIVDFGGTQAPVAWGVTPGFVGTGKTLTFGSAIADNTIALTNGIDLGAEARTIYVSNQTAVLAGQLVGTNAGGTLLFKTGPGILTLTASNRFVGNIEVLEGTLRPGTNINSTGGGTASATNAFGGAGLVWVQPGAVLDYNYGWTFAGKTNVVSGTGIMGAALTNSSTAGATNNAPVWLLGDTTVGTSSARLRLAGGISNAPWVGDLLTLTKVGSGQLDMLVNSAFTGNLDVKAGAIACYNPAALGMGPGTVTVRTNANVNFNGQAVTVAKNVLMDSGMLTNSSTTTAAFPGAITLSGPTPVGANSGLTLSGNIDGNYPLSKGGPGILTLNGQNSFSEFVLSQGTVVLNHNSAAGLGQITVNPAAAAIVSATGTIAAPIIISNSLYLTNGAAPAIYASNNNVLVLAGPISGAGGLKRPASLGFGYVAISGDNTYSGGFKLIDRDVTVFSKSAFGVGLLSLGDSVIAPTNGPILNVGLPLVGANAITNPIIVYTNIEIRGNAVEFAPLGVNGVVLANSTGNVLLTNSVDVQFTGNISDGIFPCGLTKTGNGVLTLGGINTYTGPTLVGQGTLNLASASACGNLTMAAGTTLAGNGGIAGNLALFGSVAPGNSIGHVSAASANLKGGAVYRCQIGATMGGAGVSADLLSVAGALTFESTSSNQFVIQLESLGGALSGFDPSQTNSWVIVQAGSLVGFDPAAVQLVDTNFVNDLKGGTFSLARVDNTLVVSFVPAAVPSVTSSSLIAYRGTNMNWQIDLTSLLANITPKGAFGLSSVTPGAMAGQVGTSFNPGYLTFQPATPDTDVTASFQYWVTNAAALRAGDTPWTTNAQITINIAATNGQPINFDLRWASNSVGIKFLGLSGQPYLIQRSTNLARSDSWVTIMSTNAPIFGAFEIEDSPIDTNAPAVFYRSKQP